MGKDHYEKYDFLDVEVEYSDAIETLISSSDQSKGSVGSIFHPLSFYRLLWKFYIFLISLLSVTMIGLKICIRSFDYYPWMEVAIQISYGLDMYFEFRRFEYQFFGSIVSDPRLLTLRYLKSNFAVDFISILPYWAFGRQAFGLLIIPFLIRSIRSNRFWLRVRTYMGHYAYISPRTIDLLQIFFLFLNSTYLSVIIFFLCGSHWLEQELGDHNDLAQRLTYSSDYVIRLISTVGLQEYSPTDHGIEIVFVIVVSIIGALLLSSLVAIWFMRHDQEKQIVNKFSHHVQMVQSFMGDNHISSNLQSLIKKYYTQLLEFQGGAASEQILSQLPIPIRLSMQKSFYSVSPLFIACVCVMYIHCMFV